MKFISMSISISFCLHCQALNYRVGFRVKVSDSDTGVLAQSVERPPHNQEVVGSNPGRAIPKDGKRWELLLPCFGVQQ